jgi:hypothetical protein
MTGTDKEAPEHDVELLLPWHAAGTLGRRDAERVEQALARDPELARRYALVREELAETVRLNERLDAASGRLMENLLTKIEAEPKRPSAFVKLGARMAGLFASLTPRTLAWSATVALLAILLQAALIADFVITDNRSVTFETASAPAVAPGAGSFLLIRFTPQATVDEITRFLETNRLSIVEGPAPGGLYKIRVAQTALPSDELERIVKTLQDNKLVGFVGAAR